MYHLPQAQALVIPVQHSKLFENCEDVLAIQGAPLVPMAAAAN
jgi:hypothetical protein